MSIFDEVLEIFNREKQEISLNGINGLREDSVKLIEKKYDECTDFLELISETIISSEYQYLFLRSESPSFFQRDFLDFILKNFEINSIKIRYVSEYFEKVLSRIEIILVKYEEAVLIEGVYLSPNSLLVRIKSELDKLNSLGHNGMDLTDEEDKSIENIIFHLEALLLILDKEVFESYEHFLSEIDRIKVSMNEKAPYKDCLYLKNICNELSNIAA